MSEKMTFIGLIDEDDGSMTLELMDEKGVKHEFRNVTVTGASSMETESGRPIELIAQPMHLIGGLKP